MTNITRARLLPIAALATLVGCFEPMGPGSFGPEGCGFFFDTHPCVDLAITPANSRIVSGDTVRFWTVSDRNLGNVAWTIAGEAGVLSDTVSMEQALAYPKFGVLVKALAPGSSVLTAKSAAYVHSTTVTVADSSAITRMAVYSSKSETQVGHYVLLSAFMQDAQYATYHTSPRWTSTDPLVISFDNPENQRDDQTLWVRAKSVGTTLLIASYLELRDTVSITVVP